MRVPDIIRAGESREEVPMRIRSIVGAAAGLAGAIIILAGCVVVEEGPGYRPTPPQRPGSVACTREYQPVCGERRGDRQTFPNACVARADGYRVSHAGACRGGGGSGQNSGVIGGGGGGGSWNSRPSTRPSPSTRPNTRPDRNPPSRQPQACTREYAPVCARAGRDTRTFSNACEARSANFRVIGSGRC